MKNAVFCLMSTKCSVANHILAEKMPKTKQLPLSLESITAPCKVIP